MSQEKLRRRGTTAEHTVFTGGEGEITIDTTKDTIVVHDGATAGGFPLLREDGINNAQASAFRTNMGIQPSVTSLVFGEVVLPASDGTLSGSSTLTYLNGILSLGGYLDFTASNSIRDNGVDAIQFDGSANVTFPNNVTIGGGVILNGSTIQVDSEITTTDAVLLMNDGEAGTGVTLGYAGFQIDRGLGNNFWFGFDEVRNRFTVGTITALSAPQIATTQILATREDSPTSNGVAYWDSVNNRFSTSADLTFNSTSGLVTLDGDISMTGDIGAGAGTFGGALTATSATFTSLEVANTFVGLVLNETDQIGGAGLWRFEATSGTFQIARNTSVSDDFATRTFPLKIDGSDNITLVGTLTGTSATFNDDIAISGNGSLRINTVSGNANVIINASGTDDSQIFFRNDGVDEYLFQYNDGGNFFRLFDYATNNTVWLHDQDTDLFTIEKNVRINGTTTLTDSLTGTSATFTGNVLIDKTFNLQLGYGDISSAGNIISFRRAGANYLEAVSGAIMIADIGGTEAFRWDETDVSFAIPISGTSATFTDDVTLNTGSNLYLTNDAEDTQFIRFLDEQATTTQYFQIGFSSSTEGLSIGNDTNLSLLTLSNTDTVSVAGTLEVNGGIGVSTAGTFVLRQKGDTIADGIGITSSFASSHRIWKDSSGVLNLTDTGGDGLLLSIGGAGQFTSTLDVSGDAQISGSTRLSFTEALSQDIVFGAVPTESNDRGRIWYDGGNVDLRFDATSTGQNIVFGVYDGGANTKWVKIDGTLIELNSNTDITGTLDVSDTITVNSSSQAILDLDSGVGSDSRIHFSENGVRKSVFFRDTSLNRLRYFSDVTSVFFFEYLESSDIINLNSNTDITGTLDVSGVSTFDSNVNIAGNLTFTTNNSTVFVDRVEGTQFSDSFIDFENDEYLSNSTVISSVANIIFNIDNNNNGTADEFQWYADGATGTELMSLTDEGSLSVLNNVDIGGTLGVTGTTTLDSTLLVGDTATFNTGDIDTNIISKKNTGYGIQGQNSTGVRNWGFYHDESIDDYGAGLIFWNTNTGTNVVSIEGRAGRDSFINNGGNVGIGTTAPDVFGRFYTRILGLSSTGSTFIQVNGVTNSGIDFGISGARTGGITSTTSSTALSTLGATPLRFETNAIERFKISSGGDITLTETIGSTSYTSGILGAGTRWDMATTGGSFFEIDNMRVRNEFRTHIFKKDIVRASNGYFLITDVAEITDSVTLSNSTAGQTVYIKDDSSTFSIGDLVWVKNLSDSGVVGSVKFEITAIGSASGGKIALTVTTVGGDGGDIVSGDIGVRVSGGYIMNDASSTYAPFMAVYDGVTTWTDFQSSDKEKVRLGNLEGITSATYGGLQGYGLHTRNIYLEGNAQIAGTLTAGDANGVGNTFYAGRIRRNLIFNSNSTTGWANYTTANNTISVTDNDVDNAFGDPLSAHTIVFSGTDTSAVCRVPYLASNVPAGETHTFSIWIKGTASEQVSFNFADNNGANSAGSFTHTLDGSWQRFSFSATEVAGGSQRFVHINPQLPNQTFYVHDWQLEAGSEVTAYQPTDSTVLASNTGFGMWAIAGGFGGTIQNPTVALNDAGMLVRSNGTTTATPTDSIAIGNYTGASANSIRLANTGTPAGSGLFGYTSGGATSFALRLDGTASIAGWSFTDTQFTASNPTEGSVLITTDNSDGTGGVSVVGTPTGSAGAYFYQAYTAGTGGSARSYVAIGETIDSGWTGAYGISIVPNGKETSAYFRVDRNMSTGALTAKIAGWNFDTTKLYNGTDIVLDSSAKEIYINNKNSYASTTNGLWFGMDGATPKFNVGDATNYIKWTGSAVDIKGAITATSGSLSNLSVSGAITLGAGGSIIADKIKLDDSGLFMEGSNSIGTPEAFMTYVDSQVGGQLDVMTMAYTHTGVIHKLGFSSVLDEIDIMGVATVLSSGMDVAGTLEEDSKKVSRFLGVETDPLGHLSTGVKDGDWYYVKNVTYASSPFVADGLYMRADSSWIKVS